MPPIWKEQLNRLLNQLRAKFGASPRIAVLGVGNPMRSDDAAGILVARALSKWEYAPEIEHILILEAGQAPENWTGELRKFGPDLVLMIDAADVGETPGTIHWIPEQNIDGMSASTHSLPLSMLARFLRLDLNCTVAFLGIQVDSNEVGERVSPEVLHAVDEIVGELEVSLRIP